MRNNYGSKIINADYRCKLPEQNNYYSFLESLRKSFTSHYNLDIILLNLIRMKRRKWCLNPECIVTVHVAGKAFLKG